MSEWRVTGEWHTWQVNVGHKTYQDGFKFPDSFFFIISVQEKLGKAWKKGVCMMALFPKFVIEDFMIFFLNWIILSKIDPNFMR